MNTKIYAAATLTLMATSPFARAQTIPLPTGNQFSLWNTGVTGTIETTFTGGLTVRTNNPDPRLYGTSFGSSGNLKGGLAQGDVNDDGDLNYRKGSIVDSPLKMFSRLKLEDRNYSVVVSTRAFVDPSLLNEDVPQGNFPNGYQANASLSDRGFTALNKFDNIVPWEAYATGTWSVDKNILTLSAGREAVNWSKALFFVDASHISPLDITSLNEPGVLTDREADIPIGVIDANYKLVDGLEFEGFWQFEQRNDNLPACGTFYSVLDIGFDPSCAGVNGNVFLSIDGAKLPASAAAYDTDGYSAANGYEIRRSSDLSAGSAEQGGVAVRYHLAPVGVDMSLYFVNLESRVPLFDAHTNVNGSIKPPNAALLALGAPLSYAGTVSALQDLNYNFDYPGNIRTVGFNATGSIYAWKTSVEVEYTDNLPVQLNAPDVLTGALGAGPDAHRVIPGVDEFFQSYDRLHVVKADVNTFRIIPSMLHAEALVLLAELQYQGITNLPPLSDSRYGRGFEYGYSTNGLPGCLATTSPGAGLSSGCFNNGFDTPSAFGYRLHAALVYAIGNFTVTPSLLWLHDVSGYSADSLIIQNRRLLSPGIDWSWKKRFFGGTSYTHEFNASTFDTSKDRDYVKVYAGVNF